MAGNAQQPSPVAHYIYGIDIRDAEFLELTYDSGSSDHPANWGSKLNSAKIYPSYQDAWNRMQQLYKLNRNAGLTKLVGISFGILTVSNHSAVTEVSAEERMTEILGKFNVPSGKF